MIRSTQIHYRVDRFAKLVGSFYATRRGVRFEFSYDEANLRVIKVHRTHRPIAFQKV